LRTQISPSFSLWTSGIPSLTGKSLPRVRQALGGPGHGDLER
jgi:hypothetical protein